MLRLLNLAAAFLDLAVTLLTILPQAPLRLAAALFGAGAALLGALWALLGAAAHTCWTASAEMLELITTAVWRSHTYVLPEGPHNASTVSAAGPGCWLLATPAAAFKAASYVLVRPHSRTASSSDSNSPPPSRSSSGGSLAEVTPQKKLSKYGPFYEHQADSITAGDVRLRQSV